jgi:LysM repeat protein/ABC-type branched-subunit amino acid transport system substrate-binding protein
LSCLLCLTSFILLGQTKSNNIQSIDGKKYYIHKIEKSQSLYSISKLYNVNLDDLYLLNPELKQGAKVNQEIKVPCLNAAIAVTTNTSTAIIDTLKYSTYKISKSETMYSLTKKLNLSEKQLISYNPSLEQGLKEGQIIIVGEKNKKKQVAPKEVKENKPIVKEPKITAPVVDSSSFKPVSKPKKTSYNIALILPFKLDETINLDLSNLVKGNGAFPTVPGLSIDFYLGFKRAIDSLGASDFEINTHLFDIDDKDSLKLIQFANDPNFKEFDFIFGPLYASGFKSVAKKAKEFHIPIVSPITQQNKILYNNIYISKTNPSQFTLMESLADYCMDSLAKTNANVILMTALERDKKEVAFVSAFKKYYNERQKKLGRNAKDTVRLAKGIAGLKNAFVPNVKNVIVSLSTNQVFVADFITQLAMFDNKKDIVLCGWESTSTTDNIDQEYLNELSYTFPHQYNLVNTASYNSIIGSYIEQQATYPSYYYFIGFDIAYYYLTHLKDKGPDFVHTLNTLPLETNYMRFNFTRPDNATGFDNRGVYIFKYTNYQLQKTGWK